LRILRNTLHNDFLRFFDIAVASTYEQRDLAAQLRHRVYSEELGLEPRVASGRESDQYDAHALHGLITHRSSGRPAGCVRLILPGDTTQLALEEHCLGSVYVKYLEKLHEHREHACEVSRMAVDPLFRKYESSGPHRQLTYLKIQCPEEERRSFSVVWLAVLLSSVALADLAGREHVYAMMDPALPRLLHRAGLHFRQAGEFMEYHGNRAAFFIVTSDAVAHLRPDLKPLYEALRDELDTPMIGQHRATA
jgi:N-acyl amino acid synthase of PEP-CTERM/exosortase system